VNTDAAQQITKGTVMKVAMLVTGPTRVALTAAALIVAPVAAASPPDQFLDHLTAVNTTVPGTTRSDHRRR
jgi:hypothetical protein